MTTGRINQVYASPLGRGNTLHARLAWRSGTQPEIVHVISDTRRACEMQLWTYNMIQQGQTHRQWDFTLEDALTKITARNACLRIWLSMPIKCMHPHEQKHEHNLHHEFQLHAPLPTSTSCKMVNTADKALLPTNFIESWNPNGTNNAYTTIVTHTETHKLCMYTPVEPHDKLIWILL